MFDFLFGKPQKPRPETEDERFARLLAEAARLRVQMGLPPVVGAPTTPSSSPGNVSDQRSVRVEFRIPGGGQAPQQMASGDALNLVTSNRVDLALAVTERNWLSQPECQSLYVWLHVNGDGSPFYIGRGRGDRAWRAYGGYAWERYIRDWLGGAYHVVIAAHGLDDATSEELVYVGLQANEHLMLKQANPYRRQDSTKVALRADVLEKDKALFAVIERTSDIAERARLASRGIELQCYGMTLHGETGRWGEVLERAGALQYGDRYYLRVAIESLVELGRLDEARALMDRTLSNFRWLRYGPATERLENIITRGTFRRRGSKKPPRGPEERWGAG